MILLVFVAVNLALMTVLFLYGVYQFMQVEEKRKRSGMQLDAQINLGEINALLQQDRHEDALQHLMSAADVDRFTAESALDQLKKQS